MPRPESPPDPARAQVELLRLAAVYKRLFNRVDGQIVWEDLCKKFGFRRSEMKDITESAELVARRTALKQVLYYVQEMRDMKEPKQSKKAALAITGEEGESPESPP